MKVSSSLKGMLGLAISPHKMMEQPSANCELRLGHAHILMALAQAADQAPSLRELFRETGGRHHRSRPEASQTFEYHTDG